MMNMTRYDRRLLVPYLRDVCSVELLLNRVQNEAAIAQNNVYSYSNKYNSDKKPIEPQSVGSYEGSGCGCWAVTILLLAVSLFCIFLSESLILMIVGCFLGMVALFAIRFISEEFSDRSRELDVHDSQMETYKQALDAYNSREGEREFNLAKAQEWNRMLSVRNQRVTEVQRLRDKVYKANVIPLPYRNIYAAHFLYDYFRSSQSDDMDHALQMFVLEEIKQKLDRIIDQQTEIILGQRAMLAEQERTNRTLAENHKREMMQLATLNENAVRRNQYLEMINTNLEVSNFFAFHDYIRRR